MVDLSYDKKLLTEEHYRLLTFNDLQGVESADNAQLAKAGFYFDQKEQILKCFACDLKVKVSDIQSDGVNIMSMHKEKKPECLFAQTLTKSLKTDKYKTFRSPLESLRFEKCRLDTFINWPVTFISTEDLAKDGFYFLRISDHCSCVFCKGVIGAWEEGDTPRGEHKRHFSQCPFIRGEAVGNIPMAECNILMKFNNNFVIPKDRSHDSQCDRGSEDVTGLGRPPRTSGTSKSRVAQTLNEVTLQDIGLCEYKGPEFKLLLNVDTRIRTYKHWPDSCIQTPSELAEAGFYYYGPSDHVRCFHCGFGICNWEKDDVPWEMHAYWYPKCNFVVLTKGLEFINKIRNGKPVESKVQQALVTESDLDGLMGLDVIQAVVERKFPISAVRGALRRKLEDTGLPFTSLESCVENVFNFTEEETRLFLDETFDDEKKFEDLSKTQDDDQIPPLNSAASYVSSSGEESVSATLPPLPSNSTPSPIAPLPSLKAHVPITQLPRLGVNISTPNQSSSSVATHRVKRSESSRSDSASAQEQILNTRHSSQTDCYANGSVFNGANGSSSSLTGLLAATALLPSADNLQKELDRVKDTMMCKVCMDAEMCIIFIPCSHMATCASCTINLSACPVCREQIKYTIKPILS